MSAIFTCALRNLFKLRRNRRHGKNRLQSRSTFTYKYAREEVTQSLHIGTNNYGAILMGISLRSSSVSTSREGILLI